jgi:signal transduction histidine kinase
MGKPRRVWFRLGQIAGLLAMAGLGLSDLQVGLIPSPGYVGDAIALVEVLTAIVVAVIWLPAHKQDSWRLAIQSIGLAVWSLLVTATSLTVAGSSGQAGSWGFAEAGGIIGLTMVVARRAPRRAVVPTLLCLGAALAVSPARATLSNPAELVSLSLVMLLAAAGSIGGGVYLRVQESGRAQAVRTVRSEQRAEFARDLHDFIAHHVTGIVVQAQGAKFIAETDPGRAMLALEQIERAGAETMTAMRRMVGVLRDEKADPNAPLAPLAGIDELGPLIAGFSESAPPIAHLHLEGDHQGLPVEVSSSAYRVVMEALTNVRQHSVNPQVVDVWVRKTANWLLVRIADDGEPSRNTGPRDRAGFGIVGLQERVGAVGGRIQAGPGIEGGWVVDAALPISTEAAR